MYGIIYLLLNKINNKAYVGQTVQKFERRLAAHCRAKNKTKLYSAIKKYGWDNFDKLILDIGHSKEQLDILEDFYIEKFQSIEFGYNLKNGGAAGRYSSESKERMSNSAKGRISPNKNKKAPEHVANMLKTMNIGKKQSQATKLKKSIAASKFKKQIICLETQEVFDSIKECSKKLNLHRGHLSEHIAGKHKSIKGLHFERVYNG